MRILQALPQDLQRTVQQDATLVRGNARFGALRWQASQAQLRVGAERAGALQGHRPRAAGHGIGDVPGVAARIGERLGESATVQG